MKKIKRAGKGRAVGCDEKVLPGGIVMGEVGLEDGEESIK